MEPPQLRSIGPDGSLLTPFFGVEPHISGSTLELEQWHSANPDLRGPLDECVDYTVDGYPVEPYTANFTGHGRSRPRDRFRAEENLCQYFSERGLVRILRTRWDLHHITFRSFAHWMEVVLKDYENPEVSLPCVHRLLVQPRRICLPQQAP